MPYQMFPKTIQDKFPKPYSTDDLGFDKIKVITKFFDAFGSWKWYATEYDPEHETFFGWVHGSDPELGYFSMEEFKSLPSVMGVPRIERDINWKATTTLKEVMDASNTGNPL